MANYKQKKTGLYDLIRESTEVDVCGDNLITFSIDVDLRYINYMISKNNFKKYLNKLQKIFENEKITIKEIKDILDNDIYETYKTRVSQKRIPQILLNLLVKENYLYSDNLIDYEIKKTKKDLNKLIEKYTRDI